MDTTKKTYKPPEFRRVRLDVKSAVLGTCATSTSADSQGFNQCRYPWPDPCYS